MNALKWNAHRAAGQSMLEPIAFLTRIAYPVLRNPAAMPLIEM